MLLFSQGKQTVLHALSPNRFYFIDKVDTFMSVWSY